MASTDSTDPVPIATFSDPMEAQLALAALQGSGIEAYLDQPVFPLTGRESIRLSGGIRLFVRAEDAERAIGALQHPDKSE